jgi:hypothetical protein
VKRFMLALAQVQWDAAVDTRPFGDLHATAAMVL